MAKGDRFDEFLYAARDLSLVAPRVDPSQIGRHGGEQLVDGLCAGVDVAGYCGREGSLERADAVP